MKLINLNLYYLYQKLTKTNIFLKKLDRCTLEQKYVLLSILAKNKNTKYGQKYKFKNIKNFSDFKREVPIQNYEDLREYIEEELNGEKNSIISDKIKTFAISSGTTDKVKYIPHTIESILMRKRSWEIWVNILMRENPKTFSIMSKILNFTSKEFDGYTKGHTKFGSISGVINSIQPLIIRLKYPIPKEVYEIEDFNLRYYLFILFSISKDIRLIITPNPSTLLIYAKKINQNILEIIEDLENNEIKELKNNKNVDNKIKEQLNRKFKSIKNKKVGLKIRNLLKEKKTIYPKDIFTNLNILGCWKGGPMKFYLDKLPKYYGENIIIREIGYMASEGRFTIPINNKTNDGVLNIESGFYEFIKINDYEKTGLKSKTLLANELKINQKYYMIITNHCALYRYFIDDIVIVTSFEKSTPVLKFLQKGKYFSSITGEKISEWEVVDSLQKSLKNNFSNVETFFAIPIMSEKPYYKYYIEFKKDISKNKIKLLEEKLERNMQKVNIEYKEKRQSLRLNKIKISKLKKNSFLTIKKEFSKNRKNDFQVKIPKLIVLEKDKNLLKKIKFL